jgi:hypothetical protein
MLKAMTRSLVTPAIALLAFASAVVERRAEVPERTFAVLIENVSTPATLRLPNGSTTSAPVAPGAYAVVTDDNVVFRADKPAESSGLENLAENGNAEPLINSLKKLANVRAAGIFVPGQTFDIKVNPGDRLVFAAMFVQSNDLFYAPGPGGIALFKSTGDAIAGDVTTQVRLWDAGMEVNQVPGAGPDQASRQKMPNAGKAENGVVQPVSDGFTYPAVQDLLGVIVTPQLITH